MNCTACDGPVVETTYYTFVCTECGLERTGNLNPELVNVSDAYNTLCTAYSRGVRFKNYIKQVTGVLSGCNYKCKIWKLLEKDAPFESITIMLEKMRKYKCKSKHYDCIRAFAKIFVPSEEDEIGLHEHDLKNIYKRFNFILGKWKIYEQNNDNDEQTLFFSYPWLVKKILNEYGITRFDKYIKQLRCKKRNEKYEQLFQKLVEI